MRTGGSGPTRGQWLPHGFGHPSPPRPQYREPHPIRAAGVWSGIGVTMVWFLFFGLVAWNARSYAWATLVAGVTAALAAAALNRYGDRGVALGVAVTSAVAVSIAGLVVEIRYLGGDWILW